jgi:hypothetical protein
MESYNSIPNPSTGLVNVQTNRLSKVPTKIGPTIPKKRELKNKPTLTPCTHLITPIQVQLGLLREQIKIIINDNSNQCNRFLVTNTQVCILKKSIFPQNINPYNWLKLVAGYDTFWIFRYSNKSKKIIHRESNIRLHMYPTYLKGIQSIYHDHKIRATHIVKHMIINGQKHLVTMDGHGRFVMCILLELLRMRQHLNDYTITLFDKDHITNE